MGLKNFINQLTKRRRLQPDYFKSVQLPTEVKGENMTYVKFVIMSHQRSGSSLLVKLLASHPNIVCFGELFVPSRIGYNVDGFASNSEEQLNHRNAFPISFLEDFIFDAYDESLKAVGFKLFPDQTDNDDFSKVWEWLRKQQDIKIIHLNRSDRLATLTSLQMAKKTGQYGIKDPSKRSEETVQLSVQTCREEFERRDAYFEMINEDFKAHEMLQLDYEDLNENLEESMNRVQAFLNLPIQQLKTDKVKQEVRSLEEVIENYKELSAHFNSTKWSGLFS